MRDRFVPVTPGGSVLMDLARSTEEKAWRALELAAAHMPYKDRAALVERGYTVAELVPVNSVHAQCKEQEKP